RAHDGGAPGNGDSAELVEELPPVAVDGAGGDVLAVDGVDGAGGEESGEQGAKGSASAVHAEGIERVIIAEHALYLEDHEGAEEARDDANEQGREGLNEAGGGGDGDQAGDRAGDGAAGDVDYGATGKIEAGNAAASGVEQSANAPDHVGHGTVNKNGPEGKIERHGAELHALGEGAGNEGRGNDGEHELVDHVGLFGNGGGVVGVGGKADAAQEKMLKAADEGVAVAKGQRVTADSPNDGDQTHHGETLHHGAEDVLLAHEAAVEESESGAGHEQDQCGGDQHPCAVG